MTAPLSKDLSSAQPFAAAVGRSRPSFEIARPLPSGRTTQDMPDADEEPFDFESLCIDPAIDPFADEDLSGEELDEVRAAAEDNRDLN